MDREGGSDPSVSLGNSLTRSHFLVAFASVSKRVLVPTFHMETGGEEGGGGEGVLKKSLIRGGPASKSSPWPFDYFVRKGTPFKYLLLEKGYLFHIPTAIRYVYSKYFD